MKAPAPFVWAGSSLNASGINYGLLRQEDAMRRLKELERIAPQR